jgi:hypothetical protein
MKNTFVILALLTSGCISASLDDDIIIKRHIDVASNLQSLIAPIKLSYGSDLPTNFSEKVSLSASTDVDVSSELKDFDNEKYGASYSLSNIVVRLDCGKPGCWKNVNDFSANLGNILLVKHTLLNVETTSSYVSVPATANFDDVKKLLEIGKTTLNVNIDVTLTKDLAISTSYDVEVSFHLSVNVDKTI